MIVWFILELKSHLLPLKMGSIFLTSSLIRSGRRDFKSSDPYLTNIPPTKQTSATNWKIHVISSPVLIWFTCICQIRGVLVIKMLMLSVLTLQIKIKRPVSTCLKMLLLSVLTLQIKIKRPVSTCLKMLLLSVLTLQIKIKRPVSTCLKMLLLSVITLQIKIKRSVQVSTCLQHDCW